VVSLAVYVNAVRCVSSAAATILQSDIAGWLSPQWYTLTVFAAPPVTGGTEPLRNPSPIDLSLAGSEIHGEPRRPGSHLIAVRRSVLLPGNDVYWYQFEILFVGRLHLRCRHFKNTPAGVHEKRSAGGEAHVQFANRGWLPPLVVPALDSDDRRSQPPVARPR